MGIEPTLSAWEAEVLPLNYTRLGGDSTFMEIPVKPRWCRWLLIITATLLTGSRLPAFIINQCLKRVTPPSKPNGAKRYLPGQRRLKRYRHLP